MAATIEELEKRLAQVEWEIVRLRQLVAQPSDAETPAGRGARLWRAAQNSQAALRAAVAQAFAEMGITGDPIGAEKLQEMMRACGIKPEDNLFSRGIIEMREE